MWGSVIWKLISKFLKIFQSYDVMLCYELERENLTYICAWVNALKMRKIALMIWVNNKDCDLSQMGE